MAAGLNPTCLSEVHLEDITNMKGPFLPVRDDRGHETQVYVNKVEAQTPFYQLSGGILYWIRDVSPRLKQGDRVILVFLGCGYMDTADVVLDALNRREYLTETEVIAAFPALPRDICIPLISETCCSDSWMTVASNAGAGRAPIGRYSAAVQGISTHAEEEFNPHHTIIKEETRHIGSFQETSTKAHNVFFTSHVAKMIVDTATNQEQHEELVKSSNAPGAESTLDTRLVISKCYLEDLGKEAACQDRCTLATPCHLALEGRGGEDPKNWAVKTIVWQETQMLRVGELLNYLIEQGLISYMVDAEAADKAMAGFYVDVSLHLGERLGRLPEIKEMDNPPCGQGYIDIQFDDASGWLFDVLGYSLQYPSGFDHKRIGTCVVDFLRGKSISFGFVGILRLLFPVCI